MEVRILNNVHTPQKEAQCSAECNETDPSGIQCLAIYIPLSELTFTYWPGSHRRMQSLQYILNDGIDLSTVKFTTKITPRRVILKPFQIVLLCADTLVHLSSKDSTAAWVKFTIMPKIPDSRNSLRLIDVPEYQSLMTMTFANYENPNDASLYSTSAEYPSVDSTSALSASMNSTSAESASSEPSSKKSPSISLTSSSTTSTSRSSTVVSSVSHAIVVTQQPKVNSNQGAFYNFNDYTERLQNADNDISHFYNVLSLIFAPQNNFADTEIVAEISSVTVKRMDFKRLRPGVWVNDEIVNLYIELLKRFDSDLCAKDAARNPTLFFNSWFMEILLIRDGKYNYSQVKRWTQKQGIDKNLLDYEQVIIPINISNSHWIINRINISEKRVIEGDSFASESPKSSSKYTRAVMRWIEDEHDSRSILFDHKSWSQVLLSASQFPHQKNFQDCGVFTLMAAEYFARGRKVNFDEKSMDFFRMRIAINFFKKRN